jgi:hypothetical protein
MATRKTTVKSNTETQTKDKSQGVTLEQSLKEEGQDKKPESIKSDGKETGNIAKAEQVMQSSGKSENVKLEQALEEESEGRTTESIENDGKKTGNSTKTDLAIQIAEKPEGVSLEQALKEEGEGRIPEKLDKVPTKMEKATKIMEQMWDDVQSGKVKRKDVIKRFMEEVPLSKAGSSTYYGTIKARLSKDA